MNISAKFGPNLFSGFREKDENMKVYRRGRRRTQSDDKSSHGPFGPGELKRVHSTRSRK